MTWNPEFDTSAKDQSRISRAFHTIKKALKDLYTLASDPALLLETNTGTTSKKISELVPTPVQLTDTFVFIDSTDSANKKCTLNNMKDNLGFIELEASAVALKISEMAQTTPAAEDRFPIYDYNTTVNRSVKFDAIEAALSHDALADYVALQHVPLDDAQTTTSYVWSASKIGTAISTGVAGKMALEAASNQALMKMSDMESATPSVTDTDYFMFVDDTDDKNKVTLLSTLNGVLNHNSLHNYSISRHYPLNDGAMSTEILWSSQKLYNELLAKSGIYHDHGHIALESGAAAVKVSGMAAATPAAADIFTFIDADGSWANKQAALSAIEAVLNHDSLAGFVATEHVSHVWPNAPAGWGLVDAGYYTATPPTTTTITASFDFYTAGFVDGSPIKVKQGSVWYYGTATLTFAGIPTVYTLNWTGPPLNTGAAITEMWIGGMDRILTIPFFVSGNYDGGVQTILNNIEGRYYKWLGGTAYIVGFEATQGTADTGANQPKINIYRDSGGPGGNVVSTNDSNNGIQLSATPGTWVANPSGTVALGYYVIYTDTKVDISLTVVGSNGNAIGLSVLLKVVLA